MEGKGESGCRDGVNGRKIKSLRSSHGQKRPSLPPGSAGQHLAARFKSWAITTCNLHG